jgi:hypothetical protein
VGCQDGAHSCDDSGRRSRDEQGRERTVIEPKPCSQRQRLTTKGALRRGQENLVLHADVLEEAGAELSVRLTLDGSSVGDSALQEPIETRMIVGEKTVNRSGHHLSSLIIRTR